MRARTVMTICVLVLALPGCKPRQRDTQAEPGTPRVENAPVQAKPSPPQEASVTAPIASNASEPQVRALRRYNDNAWFVQEAMRVAQWDQTLSTEISKLVKAATPDWDHANSSHGEIRGTEVAARLRPWLEMADKQGAHERAAALLVADRIVAMEEQDGNLELEDSAKATIEGERSRKRRKSPAQLEWEKLGAKFSYDEGSERFFYVFNWLRQAYALAPRGRAGDLAFVLLLQRGFDTSTDCKNGSELFREVIRLGNEFLQARDNLQNAHSADVEARVHFMMGDAYRDIVALAAGDHGDTYANPATYKPEEADARTKAIEEYRTGLALDEKSDISGIAKERLHSLEAGEAPHDTSFYCERLD